MNMEDLDELLSESLRPKDPSYGFADRVVARLQAERQLRIVPAERRFKVVPIRRSHSAVFGKREWLAAAALLLISISAGVFFYTRERSYAEVAKSEQNSDVRPSMPKTTEQNPDKLQSNPNIAEAGRKPTVRVVSHHRVRVAVARTDAEAERAKDELKLALYIASAKLNTAEDRARSVITPSRETSDDQPVLRPEK